MADGSGNEQDLNNTEEVKVYCDEGDVGKSGSENFTLEGIGLLNEAAQNANYDQRFNISNGFFQGFNFFPMMFNPYMYQGAMNSQWIPRFPFPPGFSCFPSANPNLLQMNELKPPKMDNLVPNWNMMVHDNRIRDHEQAESAKRPYVKKPLNAFMIFMREKRNEIMVECTMKESATVNQILGRKWHQLDKAEQNKYYELARDEKERHRQMYPNWSARDNYASRAKKRRYKSSCLQVTDQSDCSTSKKCRALLGVKQKEMWCKHCQGKKKCTRSCYNDGTDISEVDFNGTNGNVNFFGQEDQSPSSFEKDSVKIEQETPIGIKEKSLASDVN